MLKLERGICLGRNQSRTCFSFGVLWAKWLQVFAGLTSNSHGSNDASCSSYRFKSIRVVQHGFEEDFFSIGTLSRRAGVKVETVRYYERMKLIPPPSRTAGGHRLYDHADLRRLIFIRRARDLGFSLEDIRALLALRGARGCCVNVKSIADRHLLDVRSKMLVLVELEKVLTALVAQCPGDETSPCPVLDILDVGLKQPSSGAPAGA